MSEEDPAAAAPNDEAERLLALRKSTLLESGTDLLLDMVVHRAAMLFNAPIAVVSLQDPARQVLRASIGLGLPFTAADLAFCGEASLLRDAFFLLNARCDSRFADNAVVHGWPGIRFYASATVLDTKRQPVGALCVMDRRTRSEVTKDEMDSLKALAAEISAIVAAPEIEMKPERGW